MERGEHFRAQYLAGGIFLAVFDGTLVGRGEEEHLPVAQLLRQVVVEVAGLLGVLKNENQRLAGLHGAEDHRRR